MPGYEIELQSLEDEEMATGDHPDILSDDKKSMSESSTTFNACDTAAPSFDLNQMHSRFSDKKLYDLVLT